MDTIVNVVNVILDAGATTILPISIFIIGLIFGTGFKKAFKSGITLGIGFTGINLVLSLLDNQLAPAAQAMAENAGVELNIIDVGWPGSAAGAFAMPIAAILIPIILVVNVILIILKVTKTLNVDIWNFWHMIAAGTIGYYVTGGSIWAAVIITIIFETAILVLADKTQPWVQNFYGLEGITFPTGSVLGHGLLGVPIAWLVGKIPGIKKLNVDSEDIQNKFGIFGEPMMIGLILGFVIGLLGFGISSTQAIVDAFGVGIAMASVMYLMPQMVRILMEGLTPISDAAGEWMHKRFPGRDLFIGVDAALAVGHPGVLSTSLILVPITLVIAIFLPGNNVLPLGDLVGITFLIVMILPASKGNLVQSIISGAIMMVFVLLMATALAPLHTAMLEGTGFAAEAGQLNTSLTTSGSPLNYIMYWISRLIAPVFGN